MIQEKLETIYPLLRMLLVVPLIGFCTQSFSKPITVRIDAEPIGNFKVGDEKTTRFGKLQFRGGIVFTSENEALGGISGIRVLQNGLKFIAISDQGLWFTGDFERGAGNQIIGISSARIAGMRDTKGKVISSKRKGDAEGLEIIGEDVLVSFERKSRINRYELDLQKLDSRASSFRKSIRKFKLPNNNGLEAITLLEPVDIQNPMRVKLAVFSEHSLNDEGNIRGFVSRKKKWKEFAIRAMGEFKITDATLMPDGSIFVLERQFSVISGPAIRIRRFDAQAIVPDALLDGEIMLEADIAYQIDNLEGISAWVDDNGKTVLTLVSDNNFSFLQRNLMLEFEVVNSVD